MEPPSFRERGVSICGMRPLVFTWPYAGIFWITYIWAFIPEAVIVARAGRTVAKSSSKDSGSLQVILLGMWIALAVAFPVAFVPVLRFPATANLPAFAVGTALLFLGSLLRRHCWRILGEYFTGEVQARVDQPVIDRGAYRWVRHPSYSGGMLMFAGIGIALANWASFAILLIVSIVVYSYRVKIEEKALVQTLGEKYTIYMKTRKRFIPFVV